MKTALSLFILLLSIQSTFGQTGEKNHQHYVATIIKGRPVLNTEHLNPKTPSGYPIRRFRIISSKNGVHKFLIQEIKDSKGRVNRFIPLREENGMLYADEEDETSFVDCMLMECSTCEEVISQTGSAWCECSEGGCDQADTSDPVKDIVEYLYM